MERWQAQTDSGALFSLQSDGRLTLYDARPSARQSEIVLKGMARAVYEYCDEARPLPAILRHLEQLGKPYTAQADAVSVQAVLASLVEAQVMLHADDRYLSLAIPMNEPALGFMDNFVAELTSPQPDPGSD
jgi:hypothetical protein